MAVCTVTSLSLLAGDAAVPSAPFGIQVVDEQTGRGVPLVELETVNRLQFITDSAGWAAFAEPGLMGQKVFFQVRSHGYEYPKDGFGFAGVGLVPAPGGSTTIRVKRLNVAERLHRLTGEGIYRDSVLLGKPTPIRQPLGAGKVVGQDSTFAVSYGGKLHWFWGDTSRMSYPLGHFWMAGATSRLPSDGGLDPAKGVDLDYFVDGEGFSRPMARLGVEKGPIWIDAVCTLPDHEGRERLVCHYAHMESLGKMLDHGLAVYDDAHERFERLQAFPMDTLWRWPGQAHPVRHRSDGVDYLLMGEASPTVRVPATLNAFTNLTAFEAWTCLEPGSTAADPKFRRDADGRLLYAWRKDAPPVDAGLEWRWLKAQCLKPEEARQLPLDVESGKPVRLHRGNVAWNDYRKCWILIANQLGGSSELGEVWYAEAPLPTGPWTRARKIVTHDRYSFYNPVHHACFDQAGGRLIYFEGTYANTFSGNPVATPRYDYNQIMYRLDLGDPRLAAVRQ